MKTQHRFLAAAMLAAGTLAGTAATVHAEAVTATEARAIAREAYVYGYPMVDNYRILHSYFVDRGGLEFKAPWNQINRDARVYTPDDKALQTPIADTPYSQLGADLRAEPLVLTLPKVEPGRYFSAQFIDLYTHNFAYAGSRSTGAGRFLLAGPKWNGEKPAGIDAVIRSETELAFVFYRTQLFDAADIGKVKAVQAGYQVQTLSNYLGQPAPAAAPAIDFPQPLTVEQQRKSPQFFALLNFVLAFSPEHSSERALRARFAKLGIGPGLRFDAQALPAEIRQAVEDGMADAWVDYAAVEKRANAGQLTSADVFGSREHLQNNYAYRMLGAVRGIYGHSQEEALYFSYFIDAAGERLDAADRRYVLRFAPGQLPPVDAFWSLTMYELPSRLLSANPLNRYLVNSRMLPDLKRDADGGVTVHVQHESPGKELESNWLPAPKGAFYGVLRMYAPKADAVNGAWKRPTMQRADRPGQAG